MDQVSDMVCCHPQILLGPFLNTLTHFILQVLLLAKRKRLILILRYALINKFGFHTKYSELNELVTLKGTHFCNDFFRFCTHLQLKLWYLKTEENLKIYKQI